MQSPPPIFWGMWGKEPKSSRNDAFHGMAGLDLPGVIEAYAHYGGLSARLRRAGEIQGGPGWHMAVDDQVRALSGRTLCRPCNVPWRPAALPSVHGKGAYRVYLSPAVVRSAEK
jgi:hypothetical protein